MSSLAKLRAQAISAAKHATWEKAITINAQILEITPEDVNAMNRLGVAQLQLNQKSEAKKIFETVLKKDRSNSIARKHLDRIKSNSVASKPSFNREHFIEEPGKTKIVELHRLSGKKVLNCLSSGQKCQLVLKKRYISVETEDGMYIGAIPEDVSYRLSKLIKTGNKYSCSVHSCNKSGCTVYLKETLRSKRNQDTHSFPSTKSMAGSTSDIDDRFLLEDDDIPVQIVNHDKDDDDQSIEDIDTDELD